MCRQMRVTRSSRFRCHAASTSAISQTPPISSRSHPPDDLDAGRTSRDDLDTGRTSPDDRRFTVRLAAGRLDDRPSHSRGKAFVIFATKSVVETAAARCDDRYAL